MDRLSAKMADVAGSGQSRSVGPTVVLAFVAAVVVAIVLLWRTPASPGAPIASGSAAVSNSPVATPSSTGSAGQSTAPPPSASGSGSPASGAPVGGLPPVRHVYVLIMENKEYGRVVRAQDAPFLNELIDHYALATNYHAITHPSEPNYIALVAGSTLGVGDDGVHDLSAPNLFDQVEAAGRGWAVFAENVPLGCFRGDDEENGPDGPGKYARKHEPAISFTSISRNPQRCARITDFSHFDPEAADFELIVPNLCHDTHDCPVSTGEDFLKGFVPRITGSPEFANSVLFITWDEGSTNEGGGGHVALVAVSPLAMPGGRANDAANHYSLLRTVEDGWGLPCLAQSCDAKDLAGLFAPR
ncbi:MAG TPA: alkaline phosphatase family protein [Candidatus Limnocylindrales bacterium]